MENGDGDQLPDVPAGKWTGTEGMSSSLSMPHGHQAGIADKRPDSLSYIPDVPDVNHVGAYIYAAAVYPLVGMQTSLWEYYHSQSDVDLRVDTYITDSAPLQLYGTKFHESKEAHRLHWHGDREAILRFIEFTQTLILRDPVKDRTWALGLHEVSMPYPKSGSDECITCILLLPYSDMAAFIPDSSRSPKEQPVIHYVAADYCTSYERWIKQQEQNKFNMQACIARGDVYLGEHPQPAESYPFFKAPEIRIARDVAKG